MMMPGPKVLPIYFEHHFLARSAIGQLPDVLGWLADQFRSVEVLRWEDGTAILVRRCVVHHSMPVPFLTHLESTAIQVILAGRPVLIFAA
jgi:hypothetical protein